MVQIHLPWLGGLYWKGVITQRFRVPPPPPSPVTALESLQSCEEKAATIKGHGEMWLRNNQAVLKYRQAGKYGLLLEVRFFQRHCRASLLNSFGVRRF